MTHGWVGWCGGSCAMDVVFGGGFALSLLLLLLRGSW